MVPTLALALVLAAAGPDTDEEWVYSTEIITRTVLFGYEPAYVVSDDRDDRYTADRGERRLSEIRGRLRAQSPWVRLDVEPYTIVPRDQLRVSMAGVEISLLIPVGTYGYVGCYHHSAHNFSFRGYGYGTNLNALVLDVRPLIREFTLFGTPGTYMLRTMWQGHFGGKGTPYVFTESTDVDIPDIGKTWWTASTDLFVAHPEVRSECGIRVAAERVLPVSATLVCAATVALSTWVPGTFAKRLFLGPHFSFGMNFSRVDEFGRSALAGGIRLDLVIAENAYLR